MQWDSGGINITFTKSKAAFRTHLKHNIQCYEEGEICDITRVKHGGYTTGNKYLAILCIHMQIVLIYSTTAID